MFEVAPLIHRRPMDFLPPIASIALPASVLMLLTFVVMRLRQKLGHRRNSARDALDTVASWPPEAARVMTSNERQAHELLRRALPGTLVLAQVPLSRFVRVPSRHSYTDWLQRVGSLSADLLVCDAGSRVLAVIDVRAAQESSRGRRRHDRMARVLRAAGVHVITWIEGDLPSVSEVRHVLMPLVAPESADARSASSRPMPLIPLPEMAEILAEGDRVALDAEFDPALEPVPSGFFEEMEATPARH